MGPSGLPVAPPVPLGYETSGPFAGQPAIPYPPQQSYGYGPGVQQKTNGMAVAGFVCSLLFWFPFFFGITAILGVIFGFIGRSQITRSQGVQKGGGLALAAIIIGFVGIALIVLAVIVIAATAHCTNNGGTRICTTN